MPTIADSRQIKKRQALSRLGTSASATIETILDQINTEVNLPLRMSASVTPDALLNFSGTKITTADGGNKAVQPLALQIPTIASASINFQTQALSNASDFEITFPTPNTLNYFRIATFTLLSNGKIGVVFSAEASTEGGLVNPGSVFTNSGIHLGYIILECTNAGSGYFKTAGSVTNVIENTKIFRLDNKNSGNFDIVDINGKLRLATTNDNTTTGSNATLNTFTTPVIRLTNSSLASLDMIPAGNNGQEITLINATGNPFNISDDTGATAANRIYTGTGSTLSLSNEASIKLQYNSTASRWYVVGGSGSGSGSGALSSIFQLTNSEGVSSWSTGDNATFLGGGTLAGTFVNNTSNPLHGLSDYLYTQAAGSLNDYLASPVQTVDPRFRGQLAFLQFPYKYNGGNTDIQVIIYDVTNATILNSTSPEYINLNSVISGLFVTSVNIPSTCTQIRIGFHVKVLNSGKVFQFDDITMSTELYQSVSTVDKENFQYAVSSVVTSSNVVAGGNALQFNTLLRNTGRGILQHSNSSTNGTRITALRKCLVVFSYTPRRTSGSSDEYITLNGSSTYIASVRNDNPVGTTCTVSVVLEAGDWLSVITLTAGNLADTNQPQRIDVTAIADSQALLIPSEQFSTDTASLVYAGSGTYNLSTLPNAPVGTLLTFTTASGTNTNTQTNSAPTQTTSDMNANGFLLYGRSFSATSTANQPALIAIQIGKGLKGVQLLGFSNSGKDAPIAFDITPGNASLTEVIGVRHAYNELTGVLIINAANMDGFNTSTRYVGTRVDTGVSVSSGYFVVNASKTAALTAVPNLIPRIATLTREQASGSNAGTFTSGSWQTRALNTVVDPTGIIGSLTSNQFTFASLGEYYIDGYGVINQVDNALLKLRNVTQSTDVLIGVKSRAPSGTNVQPSCFLKGRFVVTSITDVYEVQNRCDTTKATDGFGSGTGYGVTEIDALFSIQKIK